MNILMVCSEFAPLAKTGGLADAVTGLSDALAARGHDVRVLLPRYAHLPPEGATTTEIGGARARHRFLELQPAGAGAPRVYLLELGADTPDGIYLGDDRDAARFGRLSEAAVELGGALGWEPDVLHC